MPRVNRRPRVETLLDAGRCHQNTTHGAMVNTNITEHNLIVIVCIHMPTRTLFNYYLLFIFRGRHFATITIPYPRLMLGVVVQ